MHHKFVVVDPGIVWIGSYNLTTFARNNYEPLVRIDDPAIAVHFRAETASGHYSRFACSWQYSRHQPH